MFELSSLELAGSILCIVNDLAILFSPFSFRLFGRAKGAESRRDDAVNRIAAVVFAHNEESTIGDLLTVLQAQTRPADTVYVVADNCSDNTAGIARSMGAAVLEKGAPSGGGKAAALRFVLDKLIGEDFDGFVFFDADTMPKADFIENIVEGLRSADLAVGYHTFEDLSSTWAEAGNALLGHVMWNHYFLPRYSSGVHTLVLGMGYAVRRSLLGRLHWTPRTLTEDLAFSLDTALSDTGFVLCRDAQFQDKQPESWQVSWHRMRRWMTGDLQCLKTYCRPLLKRGMHGDAMAFDLLAFMLSVPLYGVKALGMICLIFAACTGAWNGIALILLIDLGMVLVASLSRKEKFQLQLFSIPAFFYFLMQIPWIALSTLLMPTRHWVPGRKAPFECVRKNEKTQG